MARFRIEIFKRLNNERWENVYHIETVSFTTVPEPLTDIINAEEAFHSDQVLFEYARVSTAAEGDNLFQNYPINQYGLVPGSTTGGLLPLWNVAKVYLQKDLRRPDFKLYRGVVGEANTESGLLATGLRTSIANAIGALVTANPQVIFPEDPTGVYNGVSVDAFIRQRDLHRRRRRTQSPGLSTPT